jgi:hypothetical protein
MRLLGLGKSCISQISHQPNIRSNDINSQKIALAKYFAPKIALMK